ncbi:MAG: AAA domain-containing protein [Fuerstiella sp.]|nr:AAA domain-containing protein [Fuerstiella sp.]MCP4857367.1 AAA domain-containing protein [Fuerstiella sp.]
MVIWYVATFPDIGIRCLLPEDAPSHHLEIVQFVHSEDDCLSHPLSAGQQLLRVGRKRADNFLLFVHSLAELRSAPIPIQLSPGSDPSERSAESSEALVEILGDDEIPSRRVVEVIVRESTSDQAKSDDASSERRTYVAIKSLRLRDFLLTIFWFLSQLIILSVALTAWWQRPGDRVARVFCLMCCVSMPAFVGGFHWWMLAASPLLNLPFICAACLLPAVTLHFFLSFPRESQVLQDHRRLSLWLIYSPLFTVAVFVAFTYWAAYVLSGAAAGAEEFTVFQKLAAVATILSDSGSLTFTSAAVCGQLLYLLRTLVYSAIVISSVYFGLTVVSLALSLIRTQNPVEHRQTSNILIASVVSTIPILYTLYLAFYRRTEFALGQAQIPMFVASALFMAAYAHGMLRHRLILADDNVLRGRQYFLTSGLVTLMCAVLLAVGAVATRIYAVPKDSSLPLHLSLFLIIVVAIGLVLWARDRIQSVVDQRFFSEKYQLDKTLQQLNQAAGYLTDPVALARITLTTCRDVMDASTAAMFVRESTGVLRLIGADQLPNAPASLSAEVLHGTDENQHVLRRQPSVNYDEASPLQRLLDDLSAEVVCFLRSDQGIDGLIFLGTRTSEVAYSVEDFAFLQAISQMTVLALHSSRANQSLARLDSELQVKVDRIAEQQRQLSLLRAELTSLHEDDGDEHRPNAIAGLDRGEIRGHSGAILNVLETVRKAATSTATVLIRGESGTGKELLARVVQRNSERAGKPLIAVNCAALAPSLLESELFGHVRGAFTGASSDKDGRFQAADGGTLFLDEIGDIPMETQVKLLRVLQERCFEPVGSSSTVNVDVRLIAATNRDLEAMIADGSFREDLFYRLNVVSVTLPPLRERREDLIELLFFFLSRATRKTDKRIRQIEPAALAAIEKHRWPGNIRELENVVERAVVLSDGDTITLKDLPDELRSDAQPIVMDSGRMGTSGPSEFSHFERLAGGDTEVISVSSRPNSERTDNVSEKQQMVAALQDASGNKARAARALQMPRSTFYSKLKKHGLAD